MAVPKSQKSTRRKRAVQKRATSSAGARSKAGTAQSKAKNSPTEVESAKRHWWQRTPQSQRPQYQKLPNVFRTTANAYGLVARDWKLIGGIVVVYGLLNLLLVRGLGAGLDISTIKAQFEQTTNASSASATLHAFGTLLSSGGTTTSAASSTYQSVLVLIVSLALVWSFRQLLSGPVQQLRIRDGFYKGMYPFVPVLLLLFVVGLQLIPMAIGSYMLGLVASSGIAVNGLEAAFWLFLWLLLAGWSLVMLVPTLFGLYIVTLPDMTPVRALQAAKKLVRYRRLVLLRKILFLAILLLVPFSLILLFVIATVPALTQGAFFVLGLLVLPTIHAYMFTLYRQLLPHE